MLRRAPNPDLIDPADVPSKMELQRPECPLFSRGETDNRPESRVARRSVMATLRGKWANTHQEGTTGASRLDKMPGVDGTVNY